MGIAHPLRHEWRKYSYCIVPGPEGPDYNAASAARDFYTNTKIVKKCRIMSERPDQNISHATLRQRLNL